MRLGVACVITMATLQRMTRAVGDAGIYPREQGDGPHRAGADRPGAAQRGFRGRHGHGPAPDPGGARGTRSGPPDDDVAGLDVIGIDNSVERREDLAERLRFPGLQVDTSGEEWETAGIFVSGRLTSPSGGNEVRHSEVITGAVTRLRPGTRVMLIIRSPRSGFWPQAELIPDRKAASARRRPSAATTNRAAAWTTP